MVSTSALASSLRGATNDELVHCLERRAVVPTGIRDFFDLAETLLSQASLHECLTRLDRRSLALVAHASDQRMPHVEAPATETTAPAALTALFLANHTDPLTAWPEVAMAWTNWIELGLPDPREDTPPPQRDSTSDTELRDTDQRAAERAFTTTTSIAELLYELEREPVKLLASGTVGQPEARRLAELLHCDPPAVTKLIDVAEVAGLVVKFAGRVTATDGCEKWLGLGAAPRWAALADAWAGRYFRDIRWAFNGNSEAIAGTALRDWMLWIYPGSRDWIDEFTRTRGEEAELLGMVSGGIVSTPAATLLGGDRDRAATLLAASLPASIDKLYLQHDLSAIAPGPLDPGIETRLRSMAQVDGPAIASRFRFTPTSIDRAISRGETAETILAFLTGITLSGIPQPLHYLVTETAARHGLLRVGTLAPGDPKSVSYLRSDNPELLTTVMVDHNLSTLRFRRTADDRLVTDSDRDLLYRMLREARYPVAVENARGDIVEARERHGGRPIANGQTTASSATGAGAATAARTAGSTSANPHHTLVERLRAADASAPEDDGQAWLARQLETAIRSKSTLIVSVRMPNGTVVDYRLEPTSVSGGRLRARDPLSEIERTLPLSSIASVNAG